MSIEETKKIAVIAEGVFVPKSSHEQIVNSLKEIIHFISTWQPVEGSDDALYKVINKERMQYAQRLFQSFNGLDISVLPTEKLSILNADSTTFQNILNTFTERLKARTMQKADSHQEFNQFFDRAVLSNGDTSLNRVEHFVTLIVTISKEAGPQIQNIKAMLSDLHQQRAQLFESLQKESTAMAEKAVAPAAGLVQQIDAFRAEYSAEIEKAKAVTISARQAVAEMGVAEFHAEYETQAGRHEVAARNWFCGIVAVSVFVLAGILFWYFKLSENEAKALAHTTTNGNALSSTKKDDEESKKKDDAEASKLATYSWLNAMTSKILTLSILLFALHWCSRNYRAHRHQAVISRQKALALKTFRSFSTAMHSDKERDAIVRTAARFIFSNSATGYLGKDETGAGDKLIEVMSDK